MPLACQHILTFPLWRSPVTQRCNFTGALSGGIVSPEQISLIKVHEHQFCTQSRQTRLRVSPNVSFQSPNLTVDHWPALSCMRTVRKSPLLSTTVSAPVTNSAPTFGSRVQATQGTAVSSRYVVYLEIFNSSCRC